MKISPHNFIVIQSFFHQNSRLLRIFFTTNRKKYFQFWFEIEGKLNRGTDVRDFLWAGSTCNKAIICVAFLALLKWSDKITGFICYYEISNGQSILFVFLRVDFNRRCKSRVGQKLRNSEFMKIFGMDPIFEPAEICSGCKWKPEITSDLVCRTDR